MGLQVGCLWEISPQFAPPKFLLPDPLHQNAAFRTEPQTNRNSWKPLGFGQRIDGIVRHSNPKPPNPRECDFCLKPGEESFFGRQWQQLPRTRNPGGLVLRS